MRIEIRGAERLSFRERQVVVLKETGYSTEAIARRLGLAPGTVATLYNRARSKGYEVVIVIDGDPLRLFGEGDEEAPEEEPGPGGGDLG
ncbi:sigma factor-like helix-turn-helix DNA-binding protein [Thermaerobacter litoralis]